MLTIRMQRTGRKGHANFRVVVQDSRQTPTSGRVVALLGSYDPHTKASVLNKDQVGLYLKSGAQPSERVARLLKQEGVKLPEWVQLSANKTGKLRSPEKLRKDRPKDAVPAEVSVEEKPAEGIEPVAVPENSTPTSEEPTVETPPETTKDAPAITEVPTGEASEAKAESTAESADAVTDEVAPEPKPEDAPVQK